MNYYIFNRETQKLELHFEKKYYLALTEDMKKEIKSAFLFSGKENAWVSRAKFPNLWKAEMVAKKLGLADNGKIGDALTFAEQMERKAERAEELQKPINDMHGDIAFFTQPNIDSGAGRSFTRGREKMFAAWEKEYEEFKKSEYYSERAEVARRTSERTRPTDKGFIDRRIKEAEKTIRVQKKNLESYYEKMKKVEQGQALKKYSGESVTVETVQGWIEDAELIIENAISKAVYYHECMESVGGIEFSKENVKVGYIVEIARWGRCKIIGTGSVNVTYRIMDGGAAGMGGKAAYAEIITIISNKTQMDPHPFKVGETYVIKVWDGNKYANKEYKITKITEEKVTLKSGNERAITRKPRKYRDLSSPSGYSWAVWIVDGLNGTIYKNAGSEN